MSVNVTWRRQWYAWLYDIVTMCALSTICPRQPVIVSSWNYSPPARSRDHGHLLDERMCINSNNNNNSYSSNPRRRLVTPPSECRWIAVLVRKVLVCEMNLLTLWPWPLTFEPQNRVSQGHSHAKFEHVGVIHFWVRLRTNKQTDGQTNRLTRKSYPRRPT